MGNIKKHYIFDLDDTLIDSGASNTQLFVEVFKGVLDLDDPETDSYLRNLHAESRGGAMRPQFAKAIAYFSMKTDIEFLLKRNEQIQLANAHKLKAFKSARSFLSRLKQLDKSVTVFSNRQASTLMSIVRYSGLREHIDNIVSCSDLGHQKPDPYCINMIVEKYHAPKKSFIYFGDSRTDKAFAEAAGIDYLIVDNYLNKKNFYKLMLEALMKS